MLARVDLDFQPQTLSGQGRRFEPIDKRGCARSPFPVRLPKPGRKHFAKAVERWTDGFCTHLNKVDVFRIPRRRAEEQLVKGRAATKCQ